MMVVPMALVTMLLEAIIAMTSLVTLLLLTKMLAMLVGMTSSIKCTKRNVAAYPIILSTFREFKKH